MFKTDQNNAVLILLAAMTAVCTTASLGFWQLSRAAQKANVAQEMAAQLALPVITITGNGRTPEWSDMTHRRVQVMGQWMPLHTVYLDNRQMGGKPGFWVMTPLRLQESDAVVVVQRGWVQRNFQDRMDVPSIPTELGTVQVVGRMAQHAGKLLTLGSESGGQIRQNLDLSIFAQEIKKPLLPFVVVQEGADSEGLRRQWPAVDTGIHKHYGYAFQWFCLSALWVILYVWFQIIVPRKKRSSA